MEIKIGKFYIKTGFKNANKKQNNAKGKKEYGNIQKTTGSERESEKSENLEGIKQTGNNAPNV